jgi:vacuolar-type H+-ATPase subunit I/STV1
MDERNKGLIVFGIILLIIGLVASFYRDPVFKYPYQTFGIILSVAGIMIVVLGFLYPSHRTDGMT